MVDRTHRQAPTIGVTMEVLFASVSVADLTRALNWYEQLFGRAADIVPNDSEVMWCVAGSGWLNVIEDTDRAGKTVVAISSTTWIDSSPILRVGAFGQGRSRQSVMWDANPT